MTQAASMNNNAQGGIRRRATVGIFLLVEAAALLLLLIGTGGMVSTFVLASKRAGVDIPAPNLVIPTWASILAVAIVIGLAGVWQLIKGFKRYTNAVLITMISLGIIGQYLAQIYLEVKGRPRYLVCDRTDAELPGTRPQG